MPKPKEKPMEYGLAKLILERFDSPPSTRGRGSDLLRLVGYKNLKGNGQLGRCPDNQVRAVAAKLYEKAKATVEVIDDAEEYLKPIETDTPEEKREKEYRRQIYSRLSITAREGNYLSISELDEMLCP